MYNFVSLIPILANRYLKKKTKSKYGRHILCTTDLENGTIGSGTFFGWQEFNGVKRQGVSHVKKHLTSGRKTRKTKALKNIRVYLG